MNLGTPALQESLAKGLGWYNRYYKMNIILSSLGAVSATSDSVTGSVTEVLGQYQIPTVSYTATSPSLSDQARRPYFMRTVPSDTTRNQVNIYDFEGLILDIVKTLAQELETK